MRFPCLSQMLSVVLGLLMLGGCQAGMPAATETAIPPSASPTPAPTTTSIPTFTPTPVPQTVIDFTPSPYQGPLPDGAKAVLGMGVIDSWEVSPDGNYLAVFTSTNLVSLYDAATWESIWFDIARSSEAPGRRSKLLWSPDGLKIGLWTPTTVFIWEARTGKKLHRIDVADHYPESSPYVTDSHYWESAEWSPDSKHLALGSIGILLINAETGVVTQEQSIPGETATTLAWSADGTKLRAQIDERTSCLAVVWSVEKSEIVSTISDGCPVAWSSDFKIVVTTPGLSPSPSHYDIRNVDTHQNLAASDSKPAFSPDGTQIAVNDENVTQILDIRTSNILLALEYSDSAPKSFSWSPEGKVLAVGSFKTGKIWNMDTGQLLLSMNTPFSPFAPVWSHDSRLIATGSISNSGVMVWNVDTGTPIWTLLGSANTVDNDHIQFIPGSSTRLLFSVGNTLGMWDLETGEVVHQITGSRSRGFAWSEFAWSEDSSKVALITDAGSNSSQTTLIWAVATGAFLGKPDGSQLTGFIPEDKELAEDISPDGSRSVTTEHQEPEMTVTLWNTASDQSIHQIPFDFNCEGPCITHRWSPDGQRLAVGYFSSLQILRTDTGALVSVKRLPGIIEAYAFSPDSKQIAAQVGGAVIVWEVP